MTGRDQRAFSFRGWGRLPSLASVAVSVVQVGGVGVAVGPLRNHRERVAVVVGMVVLIDQAGQAPRHHQRAASQQEQAVLGFLRGAT